MYLPVEAEKRWRYLRECYTKARRNFKKIQNTETRSGAASTPIHEKNKPFFRFYDAMSFLNDMLEYKKTCSSLRFPKAREEPARVLNIDERTVPSTSASSSFSI